VDNFDGRAKEHIGSITFMGRIIPEKVIRKDKNNIETSSGWTISFYYVKRMVNICFV
jgi:hypothetical protein